jgi:rhodanese-related sulfurtransferase
MPRVLETAANMLEAGGVLLDLRTWKEWCGTGHLCGAILIPTPLPVEGKLTRSQLHNLAKGLKAVTGSYPRDFPIVIYCKKGVRAGMGKRILEDLWGFTNVLVLGGVAEPPVKDIMEGRSRYGFEVCRDPDCIQ